MSAVFLEKFSPWCGCPSLSYRQDNAFRSHNWEVCHKGISAVLADISLYPEYCSVLQFPYTGTILHDISGKTLRAHRIHVAYEIIFPQFKVHHGYVIDHEYGGSARGEKSSRDVDILLNSVKDAFLSRM